MKINWKKYLAALGSILFFVLFDQGTKYLADRFLNPANGGSDVVLLRGIFRLQYLENKGAAFGILQGKSMLLILVSALVFLLICVLYYRLPQERRFAPLLAICILIMSGAIGNFIDRMRFGHVIDFLYFELIHFPIFNVADIYVTCSAIALIVLFLFYYKEEDLDRIFHHGSR